MPPELREALESAMKESQANETTDDTIAVEQTVELQQGGEEEPSNTTQLETKVEQTESVEAITPESKESAAPVTPTPTETPEQRATHRVDRAPASWKKEAKGEWANLPLHVRQEVYRREQQVNMVMVEASKNREAVEQLNKTVAPYVSRMQAMGGVMPAIETLLRAEHTLATGDRRQSAQAMAQLIRDYGIDIQELDAVLSGQHQQQQAVPQTPDISALVQQQVQQALAPIYQQQQVAQQRIQQQAVTTVEEMSLDPRYPFFEDVRVEMADIMEMRAKRNSPITLEEAYNIAVRINPETSTQVQRQAVVQTATQQHQQAQRARVASSSVTGAPAVAGGLSAVGDGSLRGAIEAAFGNNRL